MNHRSQRIELHGEYDLANKEALAALFGSLNANSPIVVDMTNVAYIDSTFLHAIADLRRHFRPHSVTLFGVSEHAKVSSALWTSTGCSRSSTRRLDHPRL